MTNEVSILKSSIPSPAPSPRHSLITPLLISASYALKTIHGLINSSPLVHVSFNIPSSPFPATLPMIGQMGSFTRPSADISEPLDLYVHGYVSSRLMNLGRDASSGSGDDGAKGLPVCVSASHVDGIVLSLSAFNHSYNYRSAVLFGHATLVEDREEKLYAMELITNGVVPDRWRHTRLPVTGAELQSTSLLRVKIASGSAKIRDGNASDDRHDLEDQELVDRVWTGVLPMYQAVGEPVPSSYNSQAGLPEHLRGFSRDFSVESKEYSEQAARKK